MVISFYYYYDYSAEILSKSLYGLGILWWGTKQPYDKGKRFNLYIICYIIQLVIYQFTGVYFLLRFGKIFQ